uniref:Uncharacterized protein n=1 Tax=Avena sativa TaxID=4498 RepID=A0ACD5YCP5_AVESA
MEEETTSLASIHLASVPPPEETSSSFAEETPRLPSIQLASSAPEKTSSRFEGLAAPYPPPLSYRESIRSVAWPEWRIRSALSSQSGQSGSNYSSTSGASSSDLPNISAYSGGSASAGTVDFGAEELTKIARRMISDGYTQRMFQAFIHGGEQDGDLETWFAELDINWVFQVRQKHGEVWQYQLHDTSASGLQELAERWIRALTIIVVSIKELVATFHETPAVERFGKASISAMLVFVDAIVNVSKVENLHTLLQMYICVSNASYDILTMRVISWDAQTRRQIGGLLERNGTRLICIISGTAKDLRLILARNNDTWAIEITGGGGEVHRNTGLLVNCIVSMRKAQYSARNSAQSYNERTLRSMIDDMITYLKNLLWKKSKLCPDPSLRYMFLLNNSYFAAAVCESKTEYEKHMHSYLEVSWGHVLSCISTSNSHGPLRHWIKVYSLAKFQSAFHKTYATQKFWKVPDPRLRSLLRETITKRVVSGYLDYLREHPELEKQVSSGNNSPEVFEEMLGELFEG